MKKRILSLVMILPFIIMLLVFGFSRTINLFVDLAPESLDWDYEEDEAFEYTAGVWESGVELVANVYPLEADNTNISWEITGGETFDGIEHTAEDPIARIENGKLFLEKEGFVGITATVPGTSISKSFTAYLIVDDGNIPSNGPKFVILRGRDTIESSIKSYDYRYFGLYDVVGGVKQKHVETYTARVYPSSGAQDVNVSLEGIDGCANVTVNKTENGNEINIAFENYSDNFGVMKVSAAENKNAVATRFFRLINGVNVYSYDDLMYCTSAEHPEITVLRTNLESKSNLATRKNSALFGREVNGEVVCEYTTMTSTYDIKEYTNNYSSHTADDAVVHVGVTFRKSVYGNGYTINAHELTYPSDVMENYDTQIASLAPGDLFRGPLDFVKAYNCRCFGQDNIGFMVQGDDVVIDNVTLKNCNNVNNLSNLDYVGTVVEVDGDNVTLQYCQIMNGRTVVRSMSNKNLLIDGCLLSYAREFILKVGSNNFVYAENIPDRINQNSKAEAYAYLSPEYDKNGNPLAGNFDSTVTVRNTYFYTSGIFCIGMDTHFAGRYLYDFTRNDKHVYGMAATSYPSQVKLEGHVRFYDWKTVDGLDSTTLIDLGVSEAGTDYTQLFDISRVMENYFTHNPESNMVLVDGETHYVHGGVAFYGGGRNLSVVDFSGLDDMEKSLFSDIEKPFEISLDDTSLGLSPILIGAAGYGPFQFYMYNPSRTEITVGSTPIVSELSNYVTSL